MKFRTVAVTAAAIAVLAVGLNVLGSPVADALSCAKTKAWTNAKAEKFNRNGFCLEKDDRKFIFQGDGNLVVYNTKTNRAVWSSGTRKAGRTLQFDKNGSVNVRNKSNKVIWSTDKDNNNVAGRSTKYTLYVDNEATQVLGKTAKIGGARLIWKHAN